MISVMQKNSLKDGYYYSGYVMQNYTVYSKDQPMIVAMWDGSAMCFWFWENEANRKTKTKLSFLPDIEDEIQAGFVPVKEVIPREEHVI